MDDVSASPATDLTARHVSDLANTRHWRKAVLLTAYVGMYVLLLLLKCDWSACAVWTRCMYHLKLT